MSFPGILESNDEHVDAVESEEDRVGRTGAGGAAAEHAAGAWSVPRAASQDYPHRDRQVSRWWVHARSERMQDVASWGMLEASMAAKYGGAPITEQPEHFARRHFDNLSLGDARRSRRALMLAEAVSARPGASITLCGGWVSPGQIGVPPSSVLTSR